MKRIIFFVLLFAALKVAGQTTGYFRFDTVRIMKQNGTCELYIINKTKDSIGLLTNVGGGLTQFIKTKKYHDTCIIIGRDTICGIGGSGTTPGGSDTQVQFNDGGSFGGDSGFTYNKTQNKVTTDSLLLNKHLRFLGNSIDVNTHAAIQLGDADNPFITDTVTGTTIGTVMKIYPKFSCDTCTRNQPFFFTVGTSEQTPPYTPDAAIKFGYGDGDFSRSLGYLQLEEAFFDQSEFYFEYKPENSGNRIRPFAYNMILNDTNGYVQGIHTEDQAVFHAGNGQDLWEYGNLSANNIKISPYVSADGTATTVDLSVKDSTTPAIIRGGLRMTSQKSGGSYLSTYQLWGDQVNITTPVGWLATSSGTGVSGSSGRHYIFNVTGSGKPFWVGKNWGSSYDQAFEVQSTLNTIFAPQNTADEGSKVQVYGSGDNSLYTVTDNAATNTISYPLRIAHVTSNTSANGFGTGIKIIAESAGGAARDLASIEGVYTDVTNTSEDGALVFKTIRAGTLTEGARMTSKGNVLIGSTTDNGAKLEVTGTGIFTDTLTATTMGISDSSNRVATTAWVKQLIYSTDNLTADADYTVMEDKRIIEVSDNLTSDRSFTMPTPTQQGQTLTVVMRFSSGVNHFNLASGITDNATGSTFTQLDWGKTYDFYVDSDLAWRLIRKY